MIITLNIDFALQSKFYPHSKTIYLPNPSWPNHSPIFRHSGLEVKTYRHYDPATCGFNASGCYDDLKVCFTKSHDNHVIYASLSIVLLFAEVAREVDCSLSRLCPQSNWSGSNGWLVRIRYYVLASFSDQTFSAPHEIIL